MNKAEDNYQIIRQIQDGRDFLLTMLEQNPSLLKTAEPRIRDLFKSEHGESVSQAVKQRGVSLIELIIFIVIISVALTGILLVMNQVTRHSADPLIHKQALAAAESLLEEIELQDFISQSGVTTTVTQLNRASVYHVVNDYNNFPLDNAIGIFPTSGVAAIVGLESYRVKVAIDSTASPLGSGPNIIAAGSAVRIAVTVTDPQGTAITIDGYRTAY